MLRKHHPALPGAADGNKPLGWLAYVSNEGLPGW